MIAAIALRHGLTLGTGNGSHFQRIQSLGYGLRIDDWRM
jgi:predicted nucleic acid-binding protein